jgi:hypothetical protein
MSGRNIVINKLVYFGLKFLQNKNLKYSTICINPMNTSEIIAELIKIQLPIK